MTRFICAQPDKPLFIWQLQTLLSSMFSLRVPREQIYFLVLLEGGAGPSPQMRALEQYAQIFYFEDRHDGRFYSASSKPYLFGRYFETYPQEVANHYLYVESDMLIYQIPSLPENDTWYWSDASSYLETGVHEHLLGFAPVQGRAFGFHAFGRGADHHYWYKIEKDSQELFARMLIAEAPGNKWICEMRSWMWNASVRFNNEIHPQLTFNNGKGPRRPGATLYHQLATNIFRKREFKSMPMAEELPKVNPNFCLYDYLQAIRQAATIFNSTG